MDVRPMHTTSSVFVPSKYWEEMQADIEEAVARCVDITARIANHQINGEYDAEELINCIDSRVRTLRKQLEYLVTPF